MPDAITVSDSLQTHWTDIAKQEQQEHPSHLTLSPCFERLLLPLPIVAPIVSISTTWCSLGVWPQPPAHTCDPGDFLTVTRRALAMPSQSQVGQHSESVASSPCHLRSAIAVTSKGKEKTTSGGCVKKQRSKTLKDSEVRPGFMCILKVFCCFSLHGSQLQSLSCKQRNRSALACSFLSDKTVEGDGSANIAEFGVSMQSSAARHAQHSLPPYSASGTIPSAAGLLLERLCRSSFFP